jgi:predicted HTH domain antitoxin
MNRSTLDAAQPISLSTMIMAEHFSEKVGIMTVTLDLPDDIAQALGAASEVSRRALEALAVDGYRRKSLTQAQVGRLLGLARIQTEKFLARYAALYDYSMEELEAEADLLGRLSGR